jgi:ABC-type multidrug transport system fused ATPase/permease subunit
MNNFLFLAKLTDKDLRLIIALFLILFLVFLIFALIYDVVKQVMKRQGRRVDSDMHLLVEANLIRTPKEFRHFARKKSDIAFFKQLFPAFLIAVVTTIIYGVSMIFMGPIDLFDYKTEGIGTIFYIFDWANVPTSNFFGLQLMSDWPKVISTPHFSARAIVSYVVAPLYLITIIWAFIAYQSYLSRFIRIGVLNKKLFSGNLDDKKIVDLSALEVSELDENKEKEKETNSSDNNNDVDLISNKE